MPYFQVFWSEILTFVKKSWGGEANDPSPKEMMPPPRGDSRDRGAALSLVPLGSTQLKSGPASWSCYINQQLLIPLIMRYWLHI